MIKLYERKDIKSCAELLINTYNGYPWECNWTMESAMRYLEEFVSCERFVGFTVWEDDHIIGASFCHEKTWWNNDELFIDEFYIAPEYQGKGYGKKMINTIEEYIKEKSLAGFTLLTNRYMPAPNFYRKSGFIDGEHILFMYKEV